MKVYQSVNMLYFFFQNENTALKGNNDEKESELLKLVEQESRLDTHKTQLEDVGPTQRFRAVFLHWILRYIKLIIIIKC